ncbi:hypothetical protein T4D_14520 [Trichinella pseudospiralis]|uniref:Uncharacterized protein n=1 Tax=Trichinella pseudospiralis TaxID=6337 RepID=A0A0V1F2Z3_TRIPS|nr:hypothetical protein T4D_14520 [Trichinella pseudospiralis]
MQITIAIKVHFIPHFYLCHYHSKRCLYGKVNEVKARMTPSKSWTTLRRKRDQKRKEKVKMWTKGTRTKEDQSYMWFAVGFISVNLGKEILWKSEVIP